MNIKEESNMIEHPTSSEDREDGGEQTIPSKRKGEKKITRKPVGKKYQPGMARLCCLASSTKGLDRRR